MTNNNNQFRLNIPQFAEVQELPTIEAIKQNGISPEFQEQLRNPQAKFNGDAEVNCLYSWCSHDKWELQKQLREAETKSDQLKEQALADIDEFWEKIKEYDQAWESYRSAVDFYISDMRQMGKWKDGVSTAMIVLPHARFANDVVWKVMGDKIGSDHVERIREIYNTHVVREYNSINNWRSEIKTKYQ